MGQLFFIARRRRPDGRDSRVRVRVVYTTRVLESRI